MILRHFPLLVLPALGLCTTDENAPRPQEEFWAALSSHCGNAYEGALVSEDARDVDWQGRRMIAHWAECSDERIAIAFHVEGPELENALGEPYWDRSRTWIVTRSDIENAIGRYFSLTLKHDHRHEDGEPDPVTFYGGTTATLGTDSGQDFPVDAESIALFRRTDLPASVTNVWRMEVDPAGERNAEFVYQLTRENDPTRLFRVEFDASTPVEPPPPAWGW